MNVKFYKKLIYCLFLFVLLFTFFIPSYIKASEEVEPSIDSPSAILTDLSSGKVLYEKNSNEKMYPASLTKVLTAIIVLEHCKLDEIVIVSENAVMTVSSRICNS